MKLIHEIKQQIDSNANSLWSHELHIKKHDFLTKIDEVEKKIYFVKRGAFRIYFTDEIQNEYTIRFGYQNSFICSFDSFINETPSKFNIQALKNSELQFIDRKNLMEFINSKDNLIDLRQQALCEIIGQQVSREIDLITVAPLERFNRLLERSPKVFQEIPHKYIASYLRMTPETFSRLLKS